MIKLGVSFSGGILFAVGLSLGGMTRPDRVIAFLDVLSGAWDPSLAFVMGGAVSVFAVAFRTVRNRERPLLDTRFDGPKWRRISPRLLLGAAVFGFGWGLGGFCPGPGITALPGAQPDTLIFVIAMIAGVAAFHLTRRFTKLGGPSSYAHRTLL